MSARTMRPFGPLPLRLERSIPACLAIRLASGEAKMRSPLSCPFGCGAGPGRGASACTCGVAAGAGADACAPGAWAADACGLDASALSPSPTSTAIGAFTFTPAVPSGTRILPSTPSSTASTSMVALSVSISAITSPALTSSPSFFSQRASVPSVMVGESAGIRMLVAISPPLMKRDAAATFDHPQPAIQFRQLRPHQIGLAAEFPIPIEQRRQRVFEFLFPLHACGGVGGDVVQRQRQTCDKGAGKVGVRPVLAQAVELASEQIQHPL